MILAIIWIITAELKPSDDTLQQDRNLDHGCLNSPPSDTLRLMGQLMLPSNKSGYGG